MSAPLCIELYCGTFGWSQGWLELGGRAVGFDLEHEAWHGEIPAGADLVIQDVRTLHGKQFKDAALILGSSPCQEFSWRAMPWTKARQAPPPELGMELFHAQFRIQREACEAAGRYIPLVVENVRGAQKWVGRSRWNYGSYHLWGDVPALMPVTMKARKSSGSWFSQGNGASVCRNDPRDAHLDRAFKVPGHVNKRDGHSHTRHLTNRAEHDAVKCGGDWFSSGEGMSLQRRASSGSNARRAASAAIARIPYVLSRHIAECYWPEAA